jgi:hypothetical protein
MIWAAVVAAKVSCCTHFEYHRLMYDQDGDFEVTPGHTVGLFAGLLLLHGLLVSRCSGVNVCYRLTSNPHQNSLKTRNLARFASSFVFINLGTTFRAHVMPRRLDGT